MPTASRALVVLAAALASAAPARALTAKERAGRRLFFEGASAAGQEITASVGGGTPLPAASLPCASCHGEDGQGRPEGGVVPPAITWSELTKRYGHAHPTGRKHPAFDARTVIRAVIEGIDPAGNPLDGSMPRYSLSLTDAEDLVAYLRVIERDGDPGVAATSLRIATVLPTRGRLAEVGAAMRKVLEASFEEVNAGGGIHGRRLELAVAEFDADRGGAAEALRTLLSRDPPFALVSGLAPGEEAAVAALAEAGRVPLVAPFGGAPSAETAGRYAFWALAGLRDEVRALVRYAAGDPGAKPRAAVLHAGAPELEDAARAAAADLAAAGFERPDLVRLEPGRLDPATAERLMGRGVGLVVFLGGDDDLRAFTARADELRFAPRVLAPGALVARAAATAPASFAGRIFLAYPSSPAGERPDALERLARLRRSAGVSDRNPSAQVSAVTAAALLEEGLRRAGRSVSRERLVSSLEGLFRFDTGLVPPMTFGPARRIGAPGAYVVAVDVARHAFTLASGWIALE